VLLVAAHVRHKRARPFLHYVTIRLRYSTHLLRSSTAAHYSPTHRHRLYSSYTSAWYLGRRRGQMERTVRSSVGTSGAHSIGVRGICTVALLRFASKHNYVQRPLVLGIFCKHSMIVFYPNTFTCGVVRLAHSFVSV
jgi:hypothetical protein